MITLVINNRQESESAIARYYTHLAHLMVEMVGTRGYGVVLEAGCGPGTLTSPLCSLLEKESL